MPDFVKVLIVYSVYNGVTLFFLIDPFIVTMRQRK